MNAIMQKVPQRRALPLELHFDIPAFSNMNSDQTEGETNLSSKLKVYLRYCSHHDDDYKQPENKRTESGDTKTPTGLGILLWHLIANHAFSQANSSTDDEALHQLLLKTEVFFDCETWKQDLESESSLTHLKTLITDLGQAQITLHCSGNYAKSLEKASSIAAVSPEGEETEVTESALTDVLKINKLFASAIISDGTEMGENFIEAIMLALTTRILESEHYREPCLEKRVEFKLWEYCVRRGGSLSTSVLKHGPHFLPAMMNCLREYTTARSVRNHGEMNRLRDSVNIALSGIALLTENGLIYNSDNDVSQQIHDQLLKILAFIANEPLAQNALFAMCKIEKHHPHTGKDLYRILSFGFLIRHNWKMFHDRDKLDVIIHHYLEFSCRALAVTTTFYGKSPYKNLLTHLLLPIATQYLLERPQKRLDVLDAVKRVIRAGSLDEREFIAEEPFSPSVTGTKSWRQG